LLDYGDGDLGEVELTDAKALQLALGRSVAFEGAVRRIPG
jgi:hypothetical protein